MEREFQKFSPEIKRTIIELQSQLNDEGQEKTDEIKSAEFSTDENITYKVFFRLMNQAAGPASYEFDYLTVVV